MSQTMELMEFRHANGSGEEINVFASFTAINHLRCDYNAHLAAREITVAVVSKQPK